MQRVRRVPEKLRSLRRWRWRIRQDKRPFFRFRLFLPQSHQNKRKRTHNSQEPRQPKSQSFECWRQWLVSRQDNTKLDPRFHNLPLRQSRSLGLPADPILIQFIKVPKTTVLRLKSPKPPFPEKIGSEAGRLVQDRSLRLTQNGIPIQIFLRYPYPALIQLLIKKIWHSDSSLLQRSPDYPPKQSYQKLHRDKKT